MSKVKLSYVGPFQGEVHVDLPSGRVVTQDRQLECDADDAKGLLEQPDNWQPATVKTKGA